MKSNTTDVPIADIVINHEWNCRDGLVPSDINELAKQIARMGLLQPVVVRRDKAGIMYLVAGFRRVAAMKVLRRTHVMATVRDDLTELDAAAINLAENIERKNLTPLEEARALNKLLGQGFDSKEIGQRLNRSALWVESRLAILRLPIAIQEEVARGSINLKQVRYLMELPEEMRFTAVRHIKEKQQLLETEKAFRVTQIAKKRKVSRTSKGSVRQAREMAAVRAQLFKMFGGEAIEVAVLSWAEGIIDYARLNQYIETQAALFGVDYIDVEED
jgi:ParB family chromosome partitioning protein